MTNATTEREALKEKAKRNLPKTDENHHSSGLQKGQILRMDQVYENIPQDLCGIEIQAGETHDRNMRRILHWLAHILRTVFEFCTTSHPSKHP